MSSFKLSGKALRDVAEIVSWLHREAGATAANKLEDRLFTVFRDIGDCRAIGHRRGDLTEKDLLFYTARPYVVVFRRVGDIAQILRVAHSSRDLLRLL